METIKELGRKLRLKTNLRMIESNFKILLKFYKYIIYVFTEKHWDVSIILAKNTSIWSRRAISEFGAALNIVSMKEIQPK